jgi:hypothetical protein
MTVAHLPSTYPNESTIHGPSSNEVTERRDLLSLRLRGGYVPIDVAYLDQGVVVIDTISGTFGEGSDRASAAQDLIEHLKISLKDLEAHKDELAPDLAKDLERLQFLFRK